jgi:hypothetical protein
MKLIYFIRTWVIKMSEQIGKLLLDVIPKQHRWKMDLFQNWNSIIGSLSDKVRIESINGSSLILGVMHPAWAQELFLMSHVFKNKINNALRDDKIKDIKFRTIDFKKKHPKDIQRGNCLSTVDMLCKSYVVTDLERKKFLNIENSDLREALEKFYVRCKTRRIKMGKRYGKKR